MEKLLEIRKRLGLTQNEAAKKIGVSLRTYQRYENDNEPHEHDCDLLKANVCDKFTTDTFKGFKNNGKIKLLIVVGTRPEIIRLAAVINKCRKYFDTVLCHTGQNYDYNLNGVFFKDLGIDDPDVYLNAVGCDLGQTMGNIIAKSYELMAEIKPDGILVLGDTNSCLSVIGAKRLHIPIFHMEAGNRCKDECLPEETNRRIVDIISDVNLAYSEHARRYLADSGLPKERTYVTGSPMAEVLHQNINEIESSDILNKLSLKKGKYILLSAHREENIDTDENFYSLFGQFLGTFLGIAYCRICLSVCNRLKSVHERIRPLGLKVKDIDCINPARSEHGRYQH